MLQSPLRRSLVGRTPVIRFFGRSVSRSATGHSLFRSSVSRKATGHSSFRSSVSQSATGHSVFRSSVGRLATGHSVVGRLVGHRSFNFSVGRSVGHRSFGLSVGFSVVGRRPPVIPVGVTWSSSLGEIECFRNNWTFVSRSSESLSRSVRA